MSKKPFSSFENIYQHEIGHFIKKLMQKTNLMSDISEDKFDTFASINIMSYIYLSEDQHRNIVNKTVFENKQGFVFY